MVVNYSQYIDMQKLAQIQEDRRQRLKRQQRRKKRCIRCRKSYMQHKVYQKYCSPKCSKLACQDRRRRKEWTDCPECVSRGQDPPNPKLSRRSARCRECAGKRAYELKVKKKKENEQLQQAWAKASRTL